MMTSDESFLHACTVFAKSRPSTPNMGLCIERTLDGWKVVIYQSSMDIHSVNVSGDPSIPVLINKLLAYCLVQVGNQQSKPKHISRPRVVSGMDFKTLKRQGTYKSRDGKSTKKT